jgi:hypothetical protein
MALQLVFSHRDKIQDAVLVQIVSQKVHNE